MRINKRYIHEANAYARGFKDGVEDTVPASLRSIAESLARIADKLAPVVADADDEYVAPAPDPTAAFMQRRADSNRDNAAERFPELDREWVRNEGWRYFDTDGDTVVFTPYGYRKERDVINDDSTE